MPHALLSESLTDSANLEEFSESEVPHQPRETAGYEPVGVLAPNQPRKTTGHDPDVQSMVADCSWCGLAHPEPSDTLKLEPYSINPGPASFHVVGCVPGRI